MCLVPLLRREIAQHRKVQAVKLRERRPKNAADPRLAFEPLADGGKRIESSGEGGKRRIYLYTPVRYTDVLNCMVKIAPPSGRFAAVNSPFIFCTAVLAMARPIP